MEILLRIDVGLLFLTAAQEKVSSCFHSTHVHKYFSGNIRTKNMFNNKMKVNGKILDKNPVMSTSPTNLYGLRCYRTSKHSTKKEDLQRLRNRTWQNSGDL
jgi:hypothetical protein